MPSKQKKQDMLNSELIMWVLPIMWTYVHKEGHRNWGNAIPTCPVTKLWQVYTCRRSSCIKSDPTSEQFFWICIYVYICTYMYVYVYAVLGPWNAYRGWRSSCVKSIKQKKSNNKHHDAFWGQNIEFSIFKFQSQYAFFFVFYLYDFFLEKAYL